MPEIEKPAVNAASAAVIILVLDGVENLNACLKSVFENPPSAADMEVIVVSNGVAPATLRQVQYREEIRLIEVPANLGFAGGCNLGARYTHAENLIFLNDDAVVTAGWADALIKRAQESQTIGAVCGRLLNWDGKLQEAGGVVWRNARTDRVGNSAPADDARYMSTRDVDYASACGLLVRRPAWDEIAGFSEDFFPAYYEDVDLCFRLRKAGRRVVYEPESIVKHRGSRSTAQELRLFAAEQSAMVFTAKWSAELNSREEFPGDSLLASRIDKLIDTPPKPDKPAAAVSPSGSAEPPSVEELHELALIASRREIAFKDAFIASELARLHEQLAKMRKMQKIVRRIPLLRAFWRRASAKL